MFGKIRDYFDEEINLCIVVKNAKDAYLLTKILELEVERYDMECANFEEPFTSLIRIDLAYNRFKVFMMSLWIHGYDLKPCSNNLSMIDELVRADSSLN